MAFIRDSSAGFVTSALESFLRGMTRQIPLDGLVVEIGTWKGQSAAVMLSECFGSERFLVTIDPYTEYRDVSSGKVASEVFSVPDLEVGYWAFLRQFAGLPNILQIRSTSERVAKEWAWGEIDFIFIDGDHSFVEVARDLESWVPLVKESGFVSGHDWFTPSVQKAVQEFVAGKSFQLQVREDANTWFFRKS